MDPEIKALFEGLIEGQVRLTEGQIRLTEGQIRLTEGHARLTEAQTHLVETVDELAVTVSKFITSSEERYKRLEANLDGLIRAITQEHSNGKGKVS
jgi:hypothetical protein